MLPSIEQAEKMMKESESLNPGPWVQHSLYVAKAAESIARFHTVIDPQAAYVMGYLHDIGRRCGVADMRHILDGYHYLQDLGYLDAARISLTHSYPVQDIRYGAGKWDGTVEEYTFAGNLLHSIVYDDYDRLIQLCDALALPSGFCLVEKRLLDVSLRHGVNEYTVPRWKAYLKIQQDFEIAIGRSIYEVLPGVVENTFGYEPLSE